MQTLKAAAAALLFAGTLNAAYLSSTFSEVSVDRISPGTMYSLKAVANFPYNITNKGDRTAAVSIEVIRPKASALKSGYEVIEDTSWVRLEMPFMTVGPGETRQTDVKIIIPAQEKYLGRKFEAGIWARTMEMSGGVPLSVGIESRLLMTTSKALEHAPSGKGYTVLPEKLDLGEVQAGKLFDVLRETGKVLKIYNDSEYVMDFSLSFKGEPYLTLSDDKVTVEPYSSKEVRLRVLVPDTKQSKGRRYSYDLTVTPAGPGKKVSRVKVGFSTVK